MKRHSPYLLGIATLMLAFCAGCGGGVEEGGPRREVPSVSSSSSPVGEAAEQATAAEVDYHGWRALKLTNGMVTLVAVPDIGGRIIEYKLGGHPYLWTNPAELGKTYPTPRTEQERVWHNYGGYALWPAPPEKWKGPPDPLGSQLEGGKWTGKILTASGRNVEVELRSPEDKATGLQLTRTLKLFGGSSQVRITERVTNIGKDNLDWSFVRVVQLPATVESGVQLGDKSRLYIPVSAEAKTGFTSLQGSATSQFKLLPEHLVQVGYEGQKGRVGIASEAGWLAHVDEAHEYAFLQRYQPTKLGEYPEQGSTVVVDTTAAANLRVELYSPGKVLRPGESYDLVTDWYATRVGGPIVAAGEVAAIKEPLKLERSEGKLKLTGVLGVFLPGSLAFSIVDDAGTEIGQPTTLKVTPAEVVKLSQTLPDESTGKSLVIELHNANGTPLGEVARLPLATKLAAKPEAPANSQ